MKMNKEAFAKHFKIEIITSVVEGLAEDVVLKVNGAIIKDFDWYHFDWDVYDYEEVAGHIGGLENATQGQALEQHEKLMEENDDR